MVAEATSTNGALSTKARIVQIKQHDASLRLINAVKQRPILYNSKRLDYRNIEQKMNAWREVQSQIGLPTVEACQKLWKTLRDRFIREVRAKENSQAMELAAGGAAAAPAAYASPWPYYEDLLFYKDCGRAPRTYTRSRGRPSIVSGTSDEESAETLKVLPAATSTSGSNLSSLSNGSSSNSNLNSSSNSNLNSSSNPHSSSNLNSSPKEPNPAANAPADGVPSENVPTKGVPTNGVPTESVPTESAPTENVPTEAAPTENVPSESMPTEGVPTESMPSAKDFSMIRVASVAQEPMAMPLPLPVSIPLSIGSSVKMESVCSLLPRLHSPKPAHMSEEEYRAFMDAVFGDLCEREAHFGSRPFGANFLLDPADRCRIKALHEAALHVQKDPWGSNLHLQANTANAADAVNDAMKMEHLDENGNEVFPPRANDACPINLPPVSVSVAASMAALMAAQSPKSRADEALDLRRDVLVPNMLVGQQMPFDFTAAKAMFVASRAPFSDALNGLPAADASTSKNHQFVDGERELSSSISDSGDAIATVPPSAAPQLSSSPASQSRVPPRKRKSVISERCAKNARDNDEDELFALSLVPALKRMSAPEKSLLKVRIMQSISDVECRKLASTTS